MNTITDLSPRQQFNEDHGHEHEDFSFREITDDDVEKAVAQYDNSEYARCLIESDPANEYARNILADILDFCDKQKGLPIIKVNDVVLDLDAIRHCARKAANSDAYASIERGEVKR
jgi:hypothetical protein